jgi:hypothetical protein
MNKAKSTVKAPAKNPLAYLEFKYPDNALMMKKWFELTLTTEGLEPNNSIGAIQDCVSVYWNPFESNAFINLKEFFGGDILTVKGSKNIFIGEDYWYPQVGKVPNALKIHAAFVKIFKNHPVSMGLQAKALQGAYIPTRFVTQLLGLEYNHNDNDSFLKGQVPRQYYEIKYVWVNPTKEKSKDFGAFYMIPTLYNPEHSEKNHKGYLRHTDCPDSDIYWALGQIGVNGYLEYARWNDKAGVEALVAKVAKTEKEKTSLALTALASPEMLRQSKSQHTKRLALLTIRGDFRGAKNIMKPTELRDFASNISRTLEAKYRYRDPNSKTYGNVYYANHDNINLYMEIDSNTLTDGFVDMNSTPMSKLCASLELKFRGNVSDVSIKEEKRRKLEVIKAISEQLDRELAQLVSFDYKYFLTKRPDLLDKHREFFGIEAETIMQVITPEVSRNFDVKEDLPLKRKQVKQR